MPSYTAPTKDMQYVLHDVLKITDAGIAGYEDLDRDFTAAILEEAGKISAEVLAPLNPVGDTQGCRLENGIVYTPDGFRDAFEQMKESGWPAIDMPEEFGGQGLPYLMNTAVGEMFSAANMAFMMYQGLTHGALRLTRMGRTSRKRSTCRSSPPRVDRHHEPDRAPLRHRSRPHAHEGRAARRRVLPPSPARRSSSPPASTTWPRTSCIWCWRACPTRPRA
jgi:hypothetical protein